MSQPTLRRFSTLILIACWTAAAPAQWTNVGPGMDYQLFTESGPNKVYVARMARANPSATIDTCLHEDAITGGRERLTSMVARTEDSISYWGGEWGKYRNDVVVAVNGSFFGLANGGIVNGHVQSGNYARRFTEGGGDWVGFGWTMNRTSLVGGCVTHPTAGNRVSYPATGQSQPIGDINNPRLADQLVVYTADYGTSTGTNIWGTEALVELAGPSLITPPPGYVSGTVRRVVRGEGSMPVQFGHVVLSAHGTAEQTLLANATVGSQVQISQQVVDYQANCATLSGNTWSQTFAGLAGNCAFLRNGTVQTGSDSALNVVNPRTAIAQNATYVYFIVVDGRSAASVGMTMITLGNFCVNRLAATDGVNLDGGGSSTMWVNGAIKNVPSDGSERTVANGIMMVSLVANAARSTAFSAGQSVKTSVAANLRRGPGTNWGALTTLAAGTAGTVRPNAANGVTAKGYTWWNCTFGTAEGWVAGSTLTAVSQVEDALIY